MKSLTKRVYYRDFTFQIPPYVYEPAEDSLLAADNLAIKENDEILDMGTGCGILAVVAAQKARRIVATDVNPHAVACAKQNTEINNLTDKVDVRRGDLFQPIRQNERFSVIVFNAPYLPSEVGESKSWLGKSWAGGATGRKLIDRFIEKAPSHLKRKGRILLVQSTLTNIDETLKRLREAKLNPRIVSEKKVAFEAIVLIQASHLFGHNVKRM